jgi:hypothetical protein
MHLSDKTISRLWLITVIAILLLLVATIGLALQARNQPVVGVEAIVQRRVFMRDEAVGVGRIDAVLRPGTVVMISDAVQQSGTTWYQIEVGEFVGWIPSNTVTLQE